MDSPEDNPPPVKKRDHVRKFFRRSRAGKSARTGTPATVSPPETPQIDSPGSKSSSVVTGNLSPPVVLDLWQEALDKLQESDEWKADRKAFEAALNECRTVNHDALGQGHGQAESLADAVSNKLKSVCEEIEDKQWMHETGHGHKVSFRYAVNRIAQYVQVFNEPVKTVVALDPTKGSGVIWGFIQFFVGRVIENSQMRVLALDQEPVAHLTSRFALIEREYLRPQSASQVSGLLRQRLVEVYGTVLLYQFSVYQYLEQGKITHGIHSLIPSRLKEYADEIERKAAEVDRVIPVANGELIHGMDEKLQPLGKIGGQVQQVLNSVAGMEDAHRTEVLTWISPILHEDHHNQVKPMAETGEWLFQDPEFLSWRESHQSGLLWLRGNMGTGKSNLVSVLVSHLLKQDHLEERVAFFYIDKTNRAKEAGSVDIILCSLLKQLADICGTSLFEQVVARRKSLHNSSSLHRKDCISLLKSIIQSSRQVSIVVDALDEMDDTRCVADLMGELRGLVEDCKGTVLRVFVTSRDDARLFWPMDQTWKERGDILISGQSHKDMVTFIDAKVDSYFHAKEFNKKLNFKHYQEKLKAGLREKSGGMFRWVDLSLEYLHRLLITDLKVLVTKLDSVPPDLMNLYAEVFEAMKRAQDPEGPDMVRRILTWFMYIQHDNGLDLQRVFLRAVNCGIDGKFSKLRKRDILELCSGFVMMDGNGRIGLIHLSVKEFLQDQPEFSPETGHALLAASCMTYLKDVSLLAYDSPLHPDMPILNSFAKYAWRYWARHCNLAGFQRQEQPLAAALDTFCAQPGREEKSTFYRLTRHMLEDRLSDSLVFRGIHSITLNNEPTLFFLACQEGLHEIVEASLQGGFPIDQATSKGLTGLFFACFGEQPGLVSYLFSHGATVSPTISTSDLEVSFCSEFLPAISSACSGRCQILDLLFAHGSNAITESELLFCMAEPSRSPSRSIEWELQRRHEWQPHYWKETVVKLVNRMPQVKITAPVGAAMLSWGPDVTRILLERDPSFRLTGDTLVALVTQRDNTNEIIQLFEALRSVGQEPLDQEQFHVFLSHCHVLESDPAEMVDYFIALNPTIVISKDTGLAAIKNPHWGFTLMQHLLELNPSIPMTEETVVQAIILRQPEVLQLLFHHDQSLQATQQHLQIAIKRRPGREEFGYPSHKVHEVLKCLFDRGKHLTVPETLLTTALANHETADYLLECLISRAPSVELTPDLVASISADVSLAVLLPVIASTPPENFTDELIQAAVENTDIKAEIIQEVLERSPTSPSISEATIEEAIIGNNHPDSVRLILERWPDVPLSDNLLEFALEDMDCFQVILDLRPSLTFGESLILAACYFECDTLELILARQPETAVTEKMVEALLNRHGSHHNSRLLEILLSHDPKFELSETILDLAMKQSVSTIDMVLNARPHTTFTPHMFIQSCVHAQRNLKILSLALERFKGALDEDIMLSLVRKCSARVLEELLNSRPDAVVTERCIATALKRFRRAKYYDDDELVDFHFLIDTLLVRSGLSDTAQQQWRDELAISRNEYDFPDLSTSSHSSDWLSTSSSDT